MRQQPRPRWRRSVPRCVPRPRVDTVGLGWRRWCGVPHADQGRKPGGGTGRGTYRGTHRGPYSTPGTGKRRVEASLHGERRGRHEGAAGPWRCALRPLSPAYDGRHTVPSARGAPSTESSAPPRSSAQFRWAREREDHVAWGIVRVAHPLRLGLRSTTRAPEGAEWTRWGRRGRSPRGRRRPSGRCDGGLPSEPADRL